MDPIYTIISSNAYYSETSLNIQTSLQLVRNYMTDALCHPQLNSLPEVGCIENTVGIWEKYGSIITS